MAEKETTHFGFETVDARDKARRVADVFHSVANKYDLMNDLMSMGVHRLWKRYTIQIAGVKPGDRVLDLAGGTGDLALKFSRIVGPEGLVVLSDINASMLGEGRDRLTDEGVAGNIEYAQANAEALPFPDESVETVLSTLVLCSVGGLDLALREIHRILKPGGRFIFLEHVGAPPGSWLRRFQRWVKPVWSTVGDGCEPDRDTEENLLRAGFREVRLERFSLPIPLVSPHIAGVARK